MLRCDYASQCFTSVSMRLRNGPFLVPAVTESLRWNFSFILLLLRKFTDILSETLSNRKQSKREKRANFTNRKIGYRDYFQNCGRHRLPSFLFDPGERWVYSTSSSQHRRIPRIRPSSIAFKMGCSWSNVTEQEVVAAQQKWADGVVHIGSLKDKREDCESYAKKFLNERYAFDEGTVLFKPTRCAVKQFRHTKPEAISYFIAGDERECDEDTGFATTPWTNVRFENTGVVLEGKRAIAMGNYYFTDLGGNEAKVEYTFGYKSVDGDLKIDLHHSSMPFTHPVEQA